MTRNVFVKRRPTLNRRVDTLLHHVLVSAEHAVALVRECAFRGDRSLDFDRVVVYHLTDGVITETWSHDFDPYALDEFWA